jgi:hypothetical protein
MSSYFLLSFRNWEKEGKRAPLTYLALDPDFSFMGFDQPAGNGQPKTHPMGA